MTRNYLILCFLILIRYINNNSNGISLQLSITPTEKWYNCFSTKNALHACESKADSTPYITPSRENKTQLASRAMRKIALNRQLSGFTSNASLE